MILHALPRSEIEGAIRSGTDSDCECLKTHNYGFRQSSVKRPTPRLPAGTEPLELMVVDACDRHLKHLRNWLYASLDRMMSVYRQE